MPWAGFIWYEIYFTSQSMWYNPSGKPGLLSACLLRLPPPLSCTFLGNSHDENTERGNLSMYQICWEASESEVQLHRHREGENTSQKLQWEGRERGTFSSRRTTFYSFWQEEKKYSAIISQLINTSCNSIHSLFVVFVLFTQYANHRVLFMARCKR